MHRTRLLSFLFVTALAGSASAQGVAVWQPAPGRPIVAPPSVPVTPTVTRRAQLRAQLAERRATNLARFAAYRDAGEFPQNHVRPGMLNVFIDDENHICAAANLMAQDGLLALVRQTAARDNYLRLVTVNDGPLYRWMLSSGFTQAEIDMIQEPYAFIEDEPMEPDTPVLEDIEVRRLQARFRQIERQLNRNTQQSLDEAVTTLLAYRRANGIPQLAAITAHGDSLPTPVVAVPVPVQVQPVQGQPVQVQPVAHPNPVYVSTNVPDPLVWAPHMGRRTFR